jgi:PAS domain S-box-containing protein
MTFLDITELREFWNHLLHNQEQLEEAIQEKTRSLSRSVEEKGEELERRKAAERQIEYYQKMVESSSDAMAFVDKNFRYRAANPSAGRVWGVSPQEMQGNKVADIIGQRLFEKTIRPRLEKVLKGEELRIQSWFDFASGERRFFDVFYTPHYEEGQVTGVVATARDLTENIFLQRDLEIYKHAVQASLAAIAIIDRKGFLTHVNPAFVRLWGYSSAEEIIGTQLSSLCQIPHNGQDILERMFKGQTQEGWLNIRGKDNRILTVKTLSSQLVDESDELLGLTVSFWDETERINAEKQVKQSEETYRGLFEAAAEGLIINDDQGYILEANNTALSFFGYTREEFIGLHGPEIIDAEDLKDKPFGLQHLLAGETIRMERVFVRKDGSRFTADLSAKSFPGARFIVCLHDITELKQTEEALRWSESRLRALFESSSEGLILHDLQGNILEANHTALAMFGYTLEELKKMHTRDLVHPEEAYQVDKEFEVYQHNEFSTLEHRCLRKDGTEIRVNVKGKLVAEGLVQGVLEEVKGKG